MKVFFALLILLYSSLGWSKNCSVTQFYNDTANGNYAEHLDTVDPSTPFGAWTISSVNILFTVQLVKGQQYMISAYDKSSGTTSVANNTLKIMRYDQPVIIGVIISCGA